MPHMIPRTSQEVLMDAIPCTYHAMYDCTRGWPDLPVQTAASRVLLRVSPERYKPYPCFVDAKKKLTVDSQTGKLPLKPFFQIFHGAYQLTVFSLPVVFQSPFPSVLQTKYSSWHSPNQLCP